MAARRARTHHDWSVLANASRTLADRVPLLADRLLDELREYSPQYDLAVPRDEHWQQICAALRYGIEALAASRSAPRRDLDYAAELGRRRAEQGLPVELLLHAYRQAGYVVWDELLDIVTEEDPDSLPVLVHTATQMWAGVDRQTETVTDAYRATEREMQRRTDGRGQALLDALLEDSTEPGLAQRAAAALDLPELGRYAVVVLRTERHGPGVPGEPGGMRFLWRMRTDGELGVVALGDSAGPAEVKTAVRARSPGPGGMSPVVHSLADLGRARRLAELALRTIGPGGEGGAGDLVQLDERLPTALVVSQPELAGLLVTDVFGELLKLEAADRAVLLETLDAWLECSGSAGRAATRLYCHRNTVFNRLRRLEQLTARSLSRPRDLIELTLALEAYRRAAA